MEFAEKGKPIGPAKRKIQMHYKIFTHFHPSEMIDATIFQL